MEEERVGCDQNSRMNFQQKCQPLCVLKLLEDVSAQSHREAVQSHLCHRDLGNFFTVLFEGCNILMSLA